MKIYNLTSEYFCYMDDDTYIMIQPGEGISWYHNPDAAEELLKHNDDYLNTGMAAFETYGHIEDFANPDVNLQPSKTKN